MGELHSMGQNGQLIDRIGRARLVPVIRVETAAEAVERGRAVLEAGHDVLELTTTTADWPDALRELRAAAPDAATGVGTVTTRAAAELAIELGATFLVSPYPAPAVGEAADAAGVLFMEGGFTPDQIARAAERGVAKLFPAHLGGLRYLRSLLGVLPGARIVPTGGIAPEETQAWLDAGAFAVGGSELARGDVRAALAAAGGGARSHA
jgi:2-dehydro-3-deoxyphosphogluconate aldolase/(4S)-4-hydroxy-2-oxoglutarate aldolase